MPAIPAQRLIVPNDRPLRQEGRFVLYWMRSTRRAIWNFALQQAATHAVELNRPLLVLETLACDEPFANLRQHHFALDGMADNAQALAGKATYHPFVEEYPGQIDALLQDLAKEASLLVTDDHPLRESRQILANLAEKLPVRIEAVDGNGLLPLRSADCEFSTAYAFRRFLQRNLLGHMLEMPLADPLAEVKLPPLDKLPKALARQSSGTKTVLLTEIRRSLPKLPIDQQVGAVAPSGGQGAAIQLFERFLEQGLPRYATQRNQPDLEVTSGLSPYLRWGHISAHQVVHELLQRAHWTPGHLNPDSRGQRSGWWGLDENNEAFLDQLITWRELGYQFCARRDDYQQFSSLPDWAQQTLLHHAGDPRPYLYDRDQLAAGQTHDSLWNAAQNQLVSEGRMHNYLRMLWGKKILEWSPSPEAALEVMIELNDRYALDGRDPNSYSGIGWCLGRFDRAWGPERPIFGKIRYMSSANTARKVSVKNFLHRYGKE